MTYGEILGLVTACVLLFFGTLLLIDKLAALLKPRIRKELRKAK